MAITQLKEIAAARSVIPTFRICLKKNFKKFSKLGNIKKPQNQKISEKTKSFENFNISYKTIVLNNLHDQKI